MSANGSPIPARLDEQQAVVLRAYVDSLLAKPSFATSPRRVRLMRYLLENTLQGSVVQVTEYAIGLDVFDKPESFDPRVESVVRTELSRLRQKLTEYYAEEGAADPLRIEIPTRSYALVFTYPAAAVEPEEVAAQLPAGTDPKTETSPTSPDTIEPDVPRMVPRYRLRGVAAVVLCHRRGNCGPSLLAKPGSGGWAGSIFGRAPVRKYVRRREERIPRGRPHRRADKPIGAG